MKVDVVIVTYQNELDLLECLDSVCNQRLVASVTVVDHGDGRCAALARNDRVVAIHADHNPGFGSGVNEGAALGDAEALLVLNPDAVLAASALDVAIARLEADPQVGAIQGAIMNRATGREERSAGRDLRPVHLWGRLVGARRLLTSPAVQAVVRRAPALRDHVDRRPAVAQEVEALAATAVVLRRAAFEAVGGFDETYFLYGEDLDLCRRLRTAGWLLVAMPETMATHQSGASSASGWTRELAWWSGTLTYARRHWSRRDRWLANAAGCAQAAALVVQEPTRRREVVDAFRSAR